MRRIVLVSLRWVTTVQNAEMMDATVAQCGDWVRWNGWTWLVHTDWPLNDIRDAIMRRLTNEDSVMLIEVHGSSGIDGFAPQWVWNWIQARMFGQWSPEMSNLQTPTQPVHGGLFGLFSDKDQK